MLTYGLPKYYTHTLWYIYAHERANTHATYEYTYLFIKTHTHILARKLVNVKLTKLGWSGNLQDNLSTE